MISSMEKIYFPVFSFIVFLLASPSISNQNIPITILLSRGDIPGLYTLPLNFGTPGQTLNLYFTTIISFVWSPCGSNYECPNSFGIDPKKVPTFDSNSSRSLKYMKCNDPKCWWIHAKRAHPQCSNCNPNNSSTCLKDCPLYVLDEGILGSNKGALVSETLSLPNYIVHDFIFGCSQSSYGLPYGFAGFGRGPGSLPSQLGLEKFSYTLSCHHTSHSRLPSYYKGLSYTRFHNVSSTIHPKFRSFYYVILEEIIVGNTRIKIPKKLQVPNQEGHGGTTLDVGTPFSILDSKISELVAREFVEQIGREKYVDSMDDLGPCFKVYDEKIFPKLIFRFAGDANLEFPLENYFTKKSRQRDIYCLAMLTYVDDPNFHRPAVLLGSIQQKGLYIEFDLKNERLGFQRKGMFEKCEISLQLSK